MDDFIDSDFTGLNFESEFENIFSHVVSKPGPPLARVPSSAGGSTQNDVGPHTSTHDSNTSCPSCEKYRMDSERLDKEHRVNFQFLKKKIINTDLLIRRFKTKQDESELLTKTIDNLKQKLEQATRDSSILSDQLQSTVDGMKPLQEKNSELESELRKRSLEITDLHTMLAAEEAFRNQKAALDEETRNLQGTATSLKKQLVAVQNKKQKLEVRTTELEAFQIVLKGKNKTCQRRVNIFAKALQQAQTVINDQWEILLGNGLKVGKGPNMIPASCRATIKSLEGDKNTDDSSLVQNFSDAGSDDLESFQDMSFNEGDLSLLELKDTDCDEELDPSKKRNQKKVGKSKEDMKTMKQKQAVLSQNERADIFAADILPQKVSDMSDSDFEMSDEDDRSKSSIANDVKKNGNVEIQKTGKEEDDRLSETNSFGSDVFQHIGFVPSGGQNDETAKQSKSVADIKKSSIDAQRDRNEGGPSENKIADMDEIEMQLFQAKTFRDNYLEMSDSDIDDDSKPTNRCAPVSKNIESKEKLNQSKTSSKFLGGKLSEMNHLETSDGEEGDKILDTDQHRCKINKRQVSEEQGGSQNRPSSTRNEKKASSQNKIVPPKKIPRSDSLSSLSEDSDFESDKEEVSAKVKGQFPVKFKVEGKSVASRKVLIPNSERRLRVDKSGSLRSKVVNNFLSKSDQANSHLSESDDEEESDSPEMPFKFLLGEADQGEDLIRNTSQRDSVMHKKVELTSLLAFANIESALSPLPPSPCPSAVSDSHGDEENVDLKPFPLTDSSDAESELEKGILSNQSTMDLTKIDSERGKASGRKLHSDGDGASEDVAMEESACSNVCEGESSFCDNSSSQSGVSSSDTVTNGSSLTSTEGSSNISTSDSPPLAQESLVEPVSYDDKLRGEAVCVEPRNRKDAGSGILSEITPNTSLSEREILGIDNKGMDTASTKSFSTQSIEKTTPKANTSQTADEISSLQTRDKREPVCDTSDMNETKVSSSQSNVVRRSSHSVVQIETKTLSIQRGGKGLLSNDTSTFEATQPSSQTGNDATAIESKSSSCLLKERQEAAKGNLEIIATGLISSQNDDADEWPPVVSTSATTVSSSATTISSSPKEDKFERNSSSFQSPSFNHRENFKSTPSIHMTVTETRASQRKQMLESTRKISSEARKRLSPLQCEEKQDSIDIYIDKISHSTALLPSSLDHQSTEKSGNTFSTANEIECSLSACKKLKKSLHEITCSDDSHQGARLHRKSPVPRQRLAFDGRLSIEELAAKLKALTYSGGVEDDNGRTHSPILNDQNKEVNAISDDRCTASLLGRNLNSDSEKWLNSAVSNTHDKKVDKRGRTVSDKQSFDSAQDLGAPTKREADIAISVKDQRHYSVIVEQEAESRNEATEIYKVDGIVEFAISNSSMDVPLKMNGSESAETFTISVTGGKCPRDSQEMPHETSDTANFDPIHVKTSLNEKGDSLLDKEDEKGDSLLDKEDEKGDSLLDKEDEKGDSLLDKEEEKGDSLLAKEDEKGDSLLDKEDEKGDSLLDKDEKGDSLLDKEEEKGDSLLDKEDEKGDFLFDNEDEKGDSLLDKEEEKGDTLLDEEDEKGDSLLDNEDEKGYSLSDEEDEYYTTLVTSETEMGSEEQESNEHDELMDWIISDLPDNVRLQKEEVEMSKTNEVRTTEDQFIGDSIKSSPRYSEQDKFDCPTLEPYIRRKVDCSVSHEKKEHDPSVIAEQTGKPSEELDSSETGEFLEWASPDSPSDTPLQIDEFEDDESPLLTINERSPSDSDEEALEHHAGFSPSDNGERREESVNGSANTDDPLSLSTSGVNETIESNAMQQDFDLISQSNESMQEGVHGQEPASWTSQVKDGDKESLVTPLHTSPSENHHAIDQRMSPGAVKSPSSIHAQSEDDLSQEEMADSSLPETIDTVVRGEVSAKYSHIDCQMFRTLLKELEEFYRVPPILLPLLAPVTRSKGSSAMPLGSLQTRARKSMTSSDTAKVKDDSSRATAKTKKRLSKAKVPAGDSQKANDGNIKARLRRKSSEKEDAASVKKVKLIPFTGFGSVLEAVKCDLRHYLACETRDVNEFRGQICARGDNHSAASVWPNVIAAVISILKSSDEDVLNQLLKVKEAERPPATVFITDSERSLLTLLASFIQQEQAIRMSDMMEALWNAIFDRAETHENARLAVCRMFTSLCKEQDDQGQVKNLLFNIAGCGYLDFSPFFVSAIGVWPFFANLRPETVTHSGICLAFEFILHQLEEKNAELYQQICAIMETSCQWKMRKPGLKCDELLKKMIGMIHGEGKDFSPKAFEAMKGIELLLSHKGPTWTHQQFLLRSVVSVVTSWRFGKEDNVPQHRVIAILRIMRDFLASNKSIAEKSSKTLLGQVFSNAIEKKSRNQDLEMALGECLMEVSPFQPQRSLALLATWQENNKDIIPNQMLTKLLQVRSALSQKPKMEGKNKKKKFKHRKGR